MRKIIGLIMATALAFNLASPAQSSAAVNDSDVYVVGDLVDGEVDVDTKDIKVLDITSSSITIDVSDWLKYVKSVADAKGVGLQSMEIKVNEVSLGVSYDTAVFKVTGLTPFSSNSVQMILANDNLEFNSFANVAFYTKDGNDYSGLIGINVLSSFDFVTGSVEVIQPSDGWSEPEATESPSDDGWSEPDATESPAQTVKPSGSLDAGTGDWDTDDGNETVYLAPEVKAIKTLSNSKVVSINCDASPTASYLEYQIWAGGVCKKTGKLYALRNSVKCNVYSVYMVKVRAHYDYSDGTSKNSKWKTSYGITSPRYNVNGSRKTIKNKSVVVKWKKVPGAKSYDIYAGRSLKKLKKIGTTEKGSYKVKSFSLANKTLVICVVSKGKIYGKNVNSTKLNSLSVVKHVY